MKCPVCNNVDLMMTERQTIEIDYCPQCRGVWLDRGELDKIIERSASEAAPPPPSGDYREPPRDYRHESRDYYAKDYKGYKKYKRKSLLGELFDF